MRKLTKEWIVIIIGTFVNVLMLLALILKSGCGDEYIDSSRYHRTERCAIICGNMFGQGTIEAQGCFNQCDTER